MNAGPEIDLEAGPQLDLQPRTANGTSNNDRNHETDLPHYQRLVEAVTAVSGHSKLSYGYLSFDVLHRLVLLDHQHKLARHVRDIVRDKTCKEEQIDRISDDLHKYSK